MISSTVSASGSSCPVSISLLRGRDRHAARRLGEHALGPGQQPDALDDLVVGDVRHRAAGAAHGVEHVGPVGRVADGQRAGDRVRPHRAAPRRGPSANALATGEQPVACAPNTRYGVASTSPSLPSSLEPLVDLGQLRARRHRDHDLPGQPPAELLGDLVAQGLGALGVVGPDVDVDERPVLVLGRQLAWPAG